MENHAPIWHYLSSKARHALVALHRDHLCRPRPAGKQRQDSRPAADVKHGLPLDQGGVGLERALVGVGARLRGERSGGSGRGKGEQVASKGKCSWPGRDH